LYAEPLFVDAESPRDPLKEGCTSVRGIGCRINDDDLTDHRGARNEPIGSGEEK
jgi:hypothetical protein